MENLRALRHRIRSVKNTQKITRAMQMVAGAKLRRAQEEMIRSRPYADRLERLIERYLSVQPGLKHPLIGTCAGAPSSQAGEGGAEGAPPSGLLLITSDTGLCGTYNERVAALGVRFLRENPSAQVVLVGKKGARAITRLGVKPVETISDWGGRYRHGPAMELAERLQSRFLSSQVGAWWVAYTRFVSAVMLRPTVELFLPFEREGDEGPGTDLPEKLITEPDVETVTGALLRAAVRSRFQRMLLEAFTSEHSARMMAMRNATDNAEEMVNQLTLSLNKARQAAITTELIEVVSGANALQ